MWLTPSTLLWPLCGLSFEKMDIEGWLPGILNSLMTEPTVYVPEIIGVILLALFFGRIICYSRLTSFLRNGRAD